jgi:hypothetical protein
MTNYDEHDTYWQNGGYEKISDIISAERHIFIFPNLCYKWGSKQYTLLYNFLLCVAIKLFSLAKQNV